MACQIFESAGRYDEAHELLKVQNERFEFAAKATSDVIRDWDIISGTVFWGESFETKYGFKRDEQTANIDFWLGCIHPEDLDRVKKEVDNAISDSSLSSWELQYRFRTMDDSYAFLSDKTYIIRRANGQAIRTVGALHDNTLIRNYETQLRELNEKLQKRAADLSQSNAELERFAYVASHDLQEPLRMVSSFLELLKKQYSPQLDAKAEKYINFAVDGAMRMKILILDLLEYSRIGSKNFGTEMVDFEEAFNYVLKVYEADIRDFGIKIIKDNLPNLVANQKQMVQLFQNLIGNAIKYRKISEGLIIKISVSLIKNNRFMYLVRI
jgi:signal transduction histidine kinase